LKNCVIELKPVLKKNGLFCFSMIYGHRLDEPPARQARITHARPAFAVAASRRHNDALRRAGTIHGSSFTLCPMRYALCEKLVAIER